jgi:hypothetical protein
MTSSSVAGLELGPRARADQQERDPGEGHGEQQQATRWPAAGVRSRTATE